MVVKNKILVTGLRRFDGEVDGNNYDFTKLNYILVDNELNNDREKGYFSSEILAGTSSLFDELSKYSYPALFEAEIVVSLNRKGQSSLDLKNCKYIKSISVD